MPACRQLLTQASNNKASSHGKKLIIATTTIVVVLESISEHTSSISSALAADAKVLKRNLYREPWQPQWRVSAVYKNIMDIYDGAMLLLVPHSDSVECRYDKDALSETFCRTAPQTPRSGHCYYSVAVEAPIVDVRFSCVLD